MSKKNLFYKKFNKFLLSITKGIENFFNFFKENFYYKKNFYKFLKKVDKKIFLGLVVIIFVITSYFLIPIFYDKNKVKDQLEALILDQYNLKVKLDESLKYRLFPKPHFFSKNTLIEHENNNIADSKENKVYISIKKLFSSDYLEIKDLVFKQTDFKIKDKDFKFFSDLLNRNKKDRKINFLNSKLFYLDRNDDVIFNIHLKNFDYLYQANFLTRVESKLRIFDIPLALKIDHDILKKILLTEINSYPLRLKISNNSNYDGKKLNGRLNLTIINNKTKIDYIFKNNSIELNINDKRFVVDVNIKPFFLSSDLQFNQVDFKKFLKNNSILLNILRSELLNNKNLNGKINVIINNVKGLNSINEIKFTINIEEGGVYIDNLITSFEKSVNINISDVQLIIENNKLKFAGYISLEFLDISEFYVHYQINRNYRKNIKKINFGFLFNLDDKFIEIDNLKVNGNTNQNIEKFLNEFNSNKQDILNKIIFRNSVKNFLKSF